LRGIFGQKRNIYIIRMIKSRRMRWTRHVARMRKRNAFGFWWKSQNERGH
jgi:hypothetical protein